VWRGEVWRGGVGGGPHARVPDLVGGVETWDGLGWAEQDWCCEVGWRAVGRYAGVVAVWCGEVGWVAAVGWGADGRHVRGWEHRGGLG
jgi:hypothetical protein